MVSNQGISAARTAEFKGISALNGKPIHAPVCNDYISTKAKLFGVKLLVSLIVVAFNFILKTAIISLIIWVGTETISKRMNMILRILFFSQLINTTLMMLLVHTNFQNSSVPLINKIFNGKYPDFTLEWYIKLGSFYSQTMLILGLAPIIDYVVSVMLMRMQMFLDSGRLTFPKDGEAMTSKA